jgi:hypothetical protein
LSLCFVIQAQRHAQALARKHPLAVLAFIPFLNAIPLPVKRGLLLRVVQSEVVQAQTRAAALETAVTVV